MCEMSMDEIMILGFVPDFWSLGLVWIVIITCPNLYIYLYTLKVTVSVPICLYQYIYKFTT